MDPESVETISGLGEEAAWVPESRFSGTLNILREDLVLTIFVNGESPLELAQQIAPIPLERIPRSPQHLLPVAPQGGRTPLRPLFCNSPCASLGRSQSGWRPRSG